MTLWQRFVVWIKSFGSGYRRKISNSLLKVVDTREETRLSDETLMKVCESIRAYRPNTKLVRGK